MEQKLVMAIVIPPFPFVQVGVQMLMAEFRHGSPDAMAQVPRRLIGHAERVSGSAALRAGMSFEGSCLNFNSDETDSLIGAW